MVAPRALRYFDWITFSSIIFLSALGLSFVFSATYKPEHPYSIFLYKQFFGIISGFIIYGIFTLFDYRTLQRWAYFGFYATIILLIFTMVKGSWAMGGQRWINLGFTKFQPSELAKLFFPGFFTYYLETEKNSLFTFATFAPIIAILGMSTLLIAKQPDLGTALIILFSSLVLLWLAGLNKKFFIGTFLFVIISAPISWKLLRPYQKKRIVVFLGGGESVRERYHIEQSYIAIGSGGMLGKGFLQGTQNKLQFLPESRTDSIFSVIGEELGFLGSLSILMFYLLLFLYWISFIANIKNFYAQLLALGLVMHIIFSTFINVGMGIGLAPMVGIPLPFLSYGITNLWITFASLGWLNSIAVRRNYINISAR